MIEDNLKDTDGYLHLYPDCVLVSGYTKDCIYDMTRSIYFYINHSTTEIIKVLKFKSIKNFLSTSSLAVKEATESIINFILDNQLGFIDKFSLYNETYISNLSPIRLPYSKIQNISILNAEKIVSQKSLTDVVEYAEERNIPSLNLLFNEEIVNLIDIYRFTTSIISATTIQYICFYIPFSESLFITSKSLLLDFSICEIVLYNSESNIKLNVGENDNAITLTTLQKNEILYGNYDGFVYKSCFKPIKLLYYISKKENSFWANRALLNLSDTGKINEKDIISKPKYSNVSKTQINVCKDCQHRFMCVDKRVPEKSMSRGYYLKGECGYNPYTDTWIGDNKYSNPF
ncbi:MAG: hypothetical protein ACNS60_09740 [Candidatus Cyclobacteriaceae bacterium M2_1C_046]